MTVLTRLRERFGVASELMNSENLTEFAKRYAKAWCSQNPESVAAFFAENASLTVNGGPPDSGFGNRARIHAGVSGHDRHLRQTGAARRPNRISLDINWNEHRTRRNRKPVRISGYELWKIGNDGLIAESKGHFRRCRVQTSA